MRRGFPARLHALIAAAAIAACVAGCASRAQPAARDDPRAGADTAAAAPARQRPCPEGVAPSTRCLEGADGHGAFYWIAVPPNWNHGVLVLHAHGGPEFGAPRSDRTARDLQRWAVWTRAGYAWAASTYAQGGVAVHAAAEDTERLRRLFIAQVGSPGRTVLHGQSWGGSVAAVGAELYAARDAAGGPPYDAVLLTSGVLGGGTRSYDFRLDLRVVYEAVCGNHPRADETPYPLWQGLPAGRTMSRAELQSRVEACTGIGRPAAQRSDAQRRNLKTLLAVIRIPERSLIGHLHWATEGFQDIVFKRLGGRNPFGNIGVRYRGSDDDEALNARVARYRADPSAVADFAADADPGGRISVPVLTMHAVDDPVAFVEIESAWRETMRHAGTDSHLVQLYTDDHEHSYLSDAEYIAAMQALLAWIERGDDAKPTAQQVAADCAKLPVAFDPSKGCRFLPDFQPAPLDARVPPRRGAGVAAAAK
jgi:alpha-beta hydrolase superfamily lysophospholipase